MRSGREQGSSTIVAIGVMAACLSLVAALGLVGKVFVIHARAEGSADTAALAAADITRGRASGDACDIAEEMIEHDGFSLEECISRPDLGTVKIVVRGTLPKPFEPIVVTSVAGSPGSSS